MSKWITQLDDGTYEVVLDDKYKCKWMYNEVCCNDQSEILADYPWNGECKKCKLFEREEL